MMQIIKDEILINIDFQNDLSAIVLISVFLIGTLFISLGIITSSFFKQRKKQIMRKIVLNIGLSLLLILFYTFAQSNPIIFNFKIGTFLIDTSFVVLCVFGLLCLLLIKNIYLLNKESKLEMLNILQSKQK